MDSKLTLRLDKNIIDKAKKYSTSHKMSLSKMIESYLSALVEKENRLVDNEFEISPFIKSMKTGVKVPVDIDHKKDYGNYLAEKYK